MCTTTQACCSSYCSSCNRSRECKRWNMYQFHTPIPTRVQHCRDGGNDTHTSFPIFRGKMSTRFITCISSPRVCMVRQMGKEKVKAMFSVDEFSAGSHNRVSLACPLTLAPIKFVPVLMRLGEFSNSNHAVSDLLCHPSLQEFRGAASIASTCGYKLFVWLHNSLNWTLMLCPHHNVTNCCSVSI